MSEFFPNPISVGTNLKAGLDLYNYVTKSALKYSTGVDPLDFAKATDLVNLKPMQINQRLIN